MRFSIIVPLYNKAPYIKKALGSVMEQTFKDYELIVVDDGSTDNSFSVAEDLLMGSVLDYKLIHQDNAGVSRARNNGVADSHGDFLCFLDGDDWWDNRFLERMNWLINNYPEAGLFGTNYYYVKNGNNKVCVKSANTGYIDYCKVYSNGMAMPLTSISVAIKPSIFKEFEGFKTNLKLGEDFDLWIRIALKYKVAFLNEPLAYYNQDSSPKWRGTKQITNPRYHMLWNLQYLEREEINNNDLKQLLDNLRVYSLFPYYLSQQYRNAAKEELAKVDWAKQPKKTQCLYRVPIPLLKCRQVVLKTGSIIKQAIIKHL